MHFVITRFSRLRRRIGIHKYLSEIIYVATSSRRSSHAGEN
ncbi:hypothetical protein BN903_70 [Halorubrum sp. AJ67]|nr:hypothetical protein BN903_70 [Halorubrum sp. AJ67]